MAMSEVPASSTELRAVTATVASPRRWIHHPTFVISLVVWLLGMIWGVVQIMLSLSHMDGIPNSVRFWAWPIFVLMLLFAGLQQFLVFECIHNFEQHRDFWQSQNRWLYTDQECRLRLTIVILLLIVGGEIPLLFREVLNSVLNGHYDLPVYVFSLSSALLYSSLLRWDCSAARFQQKRVRQLFAIKTLVADQWTFDQQFFYSDALGALLWWIIFILIVLSTLRSAHNNGFLEYALVGVMFVTAGFALLYCWIIYARIRKWKELLPWAPAPTAKQG